MKEKKIFIDGIETNYVIREDGTVWNLKTNRQVNGTLERNEYHSVQIVVNGKRKSIMTHRLVAEAFCENPNNYNIVHHKDGDKHNDKANNLEWVSAKKNSQEAKKRKLTTREYKKVELNEDWCCLSWIGDNFYINKNGEIWNSKTNRVLKGSVRNGYLRVNLLNKLYSIHCLVFEAFHGYRPKYIDHIDGNRTNNSLENLRETTQSDNMKNAMSKGHTCQVPILQFDKEGTFIKEYPSIQAAANEMNVARESILSSISRNGTCKGFRWKKKNLALNTP